MDPDTPCIITLEKPYFVTPCIEKVDNPKKWIIHFSETGRLILSVESYLFYILKVHLVSSDVVWANALQWIGLKALIYLSSGVYRFQIFIACSSIVVRFNIMCKLIVENDPLNPPFFTYYFFCGKSKILKQNKIKSLSFLETNISELTQEF